MHNEIIQRLMASFTSLEQAIVQAKQTLMNKPNVCPSIIQRLNSYDEVMAKQKELANNLSVLLIRQDWGEVVRHVNLINGLSAMIRDDAREILTGIKHDSNN